MLQPLKTKKSLVCWFLAAGGVKVVSPETADTTPATFRSADCCGNAKQIKAFGSFSYGLHTAPMYQQLFENNEHLEFNY